jgi:VIT1/CCC1 family predicted Fe2+/Mn2+ transporter
MASTAPAGAAARLEADALRVITETRKRVLDPVDRISEIIFGLVMVLTFTGTVRVADSGRQEIREMLIAALGCNLAWGIVDGVMYVVASAVDRARKVAVFRGIRAAGPEAARRMVLAALPEGVAAVTDEADADRMVAHARALPAVPVKAGITWDDLKGALACFLLTVIATFPPTIPFLLVSDVRRALWISNAIAVVSLFFAGRALGSAAGLRVSYFGVIMVVVGVLLVGITILLGG